MITKINIVGLVLMLVAILASWSTCSLIHTDLITPFAFLECIGGALVTACVGFLCLLHGLPAMSFRDHFRLHHSHR